MDKIPVTVLTGFLGSGKTTLLNRILSEHHGQRIAVIENEFGEIGVDQELVINADEEVFEMNNGCICCTVRGDLIRILGKLAKRRDRFDRVVLETTGLANPGPVAQTFFVDEDIRAHYALDGIVTLVDARHVGPHLDESEEAREQVAFADVLVLNKTDLVSKPDLDALERRLRGMNAVARLRRSHMAHVPLADVLGIGGFDLARALEYKPAFLEPEYPFEWGGTFSLGSGAYELTLREGPYPSMDLVLTRALPAEAGDIRVAADRMVRIFAEASVEAQPGEVLRPDSRRRKLALAARDTKQFSVMVPEAANYLLFTQHRPEEFDLRLCDALGKPVEPTSAHAFVPGHTHEDAVRSVSLEVEPALDPDLFRAWLGDLLREHGTTLYRMKGFLNFAGAVERVVLQGVHMLVDHAVLGPWGDRPRRTQLVLIGRDLDGESLQDGLSHCVA